jgi:hypothetical protein
MILRELFYYDKETFEMSYDDSYEPEFDTSILKSSDTRKTRLTLRQINRSRKASELHTKEQANELEFVRQMYGLASQAAMSGDGI